MKELAPVLTALITAIGAVLTSVVTQNPSFGLGAIAVLALVFVVGWLFVKRDRKVQVQQVQEPGHIKDVEDHPFFQEMLYYVEHVIPNLEIADRHKCFVAKAFLRVKFETFVDGITRAMTNSAFRVEDHVKLLYDLERESDAAARSIGVPDLFVERFDEEFTPIVELMKDSIASISTSKFLTGQKAKHVAILYQYLAAFHNTIVAVEHSIGSLNGELEKALNEHFTSDELAAKCLKESTRK